MDRVRALRQGIDFCSREKKKLIEFIKEVDARFHAKEINIEELKQRLFQRLKGKNAKEWINYYNGRIKEYENEINKIRIKQYSIFFGLIGIVVLLFFFYPVFTGFIIERNETISNETSINETNISEINITEFNLTELNISESNITNKTIINETNITENIINETKILSTILIIEEGPKERIVIGKPVIWKKKISKDKGEISIEIPKIAQDIIVKKQISTITGEVISEENKIGLLTRFFNFLRRIFSRLTGRVIEESVVIEEEAGIYEIEYMLPAPIITEELIGNKKRIKVSGPDEVSYIDVLTFTNINEIVKDKRFIHLYWVEQDSFVDFEAYDKDNDEYIDYIEWSTPYLSNQTFEIIIEISKAEHLDENRRFISDIYDSVKELDENWSEPIYHNEYVRVIFEEELDASNDITLYVRNIQNLSTMVEVYYYNSDKKIAEFPVIGEEGYYTIYLTELKGKHDIFDLRVKNLDNDKNAYLEFDHIVDPIITADVQPSLDIALTALDNRTFVFAWIDVVEADASFIVYDTNGTNLTGTIDVDITVNGNSRVSLAAINSTTFVIGWYDSPSQDATYAVYTRSGTNIIPATDLEPTVGGVSAIHTIHMNNRLQACYVDQPEDDADVRTVAYGTWGAGSETNVDPNIGAALNLQNLIKCAAINNTRFAMIWFDDVDNDATYYIGNENAGAVIPVTDIDTDVGETGQVAITSMNQNYFAMGWYDSVAQNIQIAVRDKNNNIVLAPTIVDANAGTQSRVAMASVKNSSEPFDWFIVAWNDRNSDDIRAAVYNVSGSFIRSFILAADENTTSLLFDVYGKDSFAYPNNSICDNTFLFAYTNTSGGVLAKTFKIDGSEWNGICDFEAPGINIPNIGAIDLIEGGTKNVVFNFTVRDNLGIGNINDSSAQARFFKIGEQDKINSSCNLISFNSENKTYECTIGMNYYDSYGVWNVSVNIDDNAGNIGINNSIFSVNLLRAISIGTSSILFPIVNQGDSNILALNFTNITNNGNYEGAINLTAYNLIGETNPAEFIDAGNFKAHISVDVCSAGTILANATGIEIAGSFLPRGPIATEEIYYCLNFVPSVSLQKYLSLLGWQITLALALLIPARKKKLKKRVEEIVEELGKEGYELEHVKEIIDEKMQGIPTSIFSRDIGVLEAVVKYMKENLDMRYVDISKILKRNERTIWASYNKVKKTERFKSEKGIRVPLNIFTNNLSIFKSVVVYLKENKNMRYSEIAKILDRDQRNIRATYCRKIFK